MSELTVELRHGVDGGWRSGSILRYEDIPRGWLEPDWHKAAGAHVYTGPRQPDKIINVAAELRAVADMAQALKTRVIDLTPADVKQMTGFTDEQIELAITHLGMPKGRVQYETDGLVGPVVAVRRVWRSGDGASEFDKWFAVVQRVFPKSLPKR